MMSNKGFTLIEVLIATIILFFSILTVNAAYKQYASYKLKQQKYENIYMAAISLMNKIEGETLSSFSNSEGEINGLKYKIKIQKIASARNYVYGLTTKNSGNVGRFLLSLYKIKMQISNKTFVLYKTQYRQVK